MMKRALDLVLASAALVLLSPVLALAGLAVLVLMGAPALFRQERVGKDGEPFEIVKLRTMLQGDGSDEDRLTAVGRFLRSSSIDELPQLWSVIRGEMSLVGPRPLLPEYVPLYSDRQARRHEVRPGITGLAQVSGRNDLGWPERLELDVEYVETQSLRLDLAILGRTVQKVVRRQGITSDGVPMEPFKGES